MQWQVKVMRRPSQLTENALAEHSTTNIPKHRMTQVGDYWGADILVLNGRSDYFAPRTDDIVFQMAFLIEAADFFLEIASETLLEDIPHCQLTKQRSPVAMPTKQAEVETVSLINTDFIRSSALRISLEDLLGGSPSRISRNGRSNVAKERGEEQSTASPLGILTDAGGSARVSLMVLALGQDERPSADSRPWRLGVTVGSAGFNATCLATGAVLENAPHESTILSQRPMKVPKWEPLPCPGLLPHSRAPPHSRGPLPSSQAQGSPLHMWRKLRRMPVAVKAVALGVNVSDSLL
ncbi:hypothetical protein G7046_g5304 [Stylonectria norvegica]|nr:hypothetical protein G7046_g5304 [Stylonectria norvegica]